MTLWRAVPFFVLAAGIFGAEESFPEEVKVAVVDVSRVFVKYRRVDDVQKKVDAEFEGRKRELAREGSEIEKEERNVLDKRSRTVPTDPDQFDLEQRFQKRLFRYKSDLQRLELEIVKKMRREMQDVLNDIRVAIRKEAEKGGYHLVMRAPDQEDVAENPETGEFKQLKPEEIEKLDPKTRQRYEIKRILEPQTMNELIERTRRNPVLYGALTIDITSSVLVTLNEDYAKTLGGP